jgi:hypothetical protein
LSSSAVDAAVHVVAVPQCGAFTIAQARACGASYTQIERWCAQGRWERGPGSILQLPGFRPSFRRLLWWAILPAPAGSYISHWSAVALRDVEGFPPTRIMITIPHGTHHVSAVARVFQTRALPRRIERIDGLPVAPLTRALVDCGRLVGPKRLGTAVDDADGAGLLTIPALQKEFLGLAASGRNGISTMRQVLEIRSEEGYVPPRAELERYLDRVLDRLPVEFEKEADLPGREWSQERVDRLCRAPVKVIVEGDGRRYHTRVRDFPRDARRRRVAATAGYLTVNYLYEELRDDPDAVEAELLEILGFGGEIPRIR